MSTAAPPTMNDTRFYELQQLIATKPEVLKAYQDANRQLVAARAALDSGQASVDGVVPSFLVAKWDGKVRMLGQKVGTINRAESEIIGLCPCDELQRQRARLQTARKVILDDIKNLQRSIELAEKDARLLADRIKALWAPEQAQDRAKVEQSLSHVNRNLADFRQEFGQRIADRDRWVSDRETLYQEMRTYQA